MSCKDCKQKATPRRMRENKPCPECVLEHIRRAQIIAEAGKRDRDRYRGYWHLAQAADLTSNARLKSHLLSARRRWQLQDAPPDWELLVDDATMLKDLTNAKH